MSKLTVRALLALALASGPVAAQRAPVKLPPRPEAPPPKTFVYPKVTLDSLPNGLRFAVVENHELPLVVVRTAFAGVGPAGISFLDPPGKEGAWGLTLASLREGTTSRSSAQITNEIGELGTEMVLTASGMFLPPYFRAARSTWRASLDLLADLLINPSFPEAGFTRVQGQLARSMDQMAPNTIANRVLYSGIHGPDSDYSRFATGATIRGLTRDDLVGMRAQYLRPQNMLAVIVGDVTVAEARQAMASAFGGWERGGTTVVRSVPGSRGGGPTTIYLRDAPGQAQSLVVAGQLLPGRDHADGAAVDGLASLLGDFSVSTGSRVYNAFRIERGLSYSPRVELFTHPAPAPSMVVATFSVAPAVTDTAVSTLLRVYRELRQDSPATAAELDFAKRNLIGRLPALMERLDQVANHVLLSLRDGLPQDYLNKWIGRVQALTLPEVQAAATRYIDPDRLTIVVVGDRSKIEAPLRALGLPVVIVDK